MVSGLASLGSPKSCMGLADNCSLVQAEWSTITIYSDATPTEPPPREKTGDDPGE